MAWQDQGRQEHGRFEHGTGPGHGDPGVIGKSLRERSLAIAYGALAALPADRRKRVEAQYHHGTLDGFTDAMTAWMRGTGLYQEQFASLFLDRAPDDRVAEALHAAALAGGLARNYAELRAASENVAKAIELVGTDNWARFVAQAQARANDPATVAAVQGSQHPDLSRNDAIRPVYPLETAIGIGAAGVAGGIGAAARAADGVILRQILPRDETLLSRSPTEDLEFDVNAESETSVRDKLDRYILNPEHPTGKEKARWFARALGFTRQNSQELAQQLAFNEKTATQTVVTQYGIKFNQITNVVGANGRTLPVMTGWIKGQNGVARLVTAFPGK